MSIIRIFTLLAIAVSFLLIAIALSVAFFVSPDFIYGVFVGILVMFIIMMYR